MGAAATGFPVVPATYVGGTVTISPANAGKPQQLVALIQAQLNANFTVAKWLRIQADGSGGGTLYGGAQQDGQGNALSTTNYGWSLTSTSAPILYSSSFPGGDVPLGDIYVFLSVSGTFHVEAWN